MCLWLWKHDWGAALEITAWDGRGRGSRGGGAFRRAPRAEKRLVLTTEISIKIGQRNFASRTFFVEAQMSQGTAWLALVWWEAALDGAPHSRFEKRGSSPAPLPLPRGQQPTKKPGGILIGAARLPPPRTHVDNVLGITTRALGRMRTSAAAAMLPAGASTCWGLANRGRDGSVELRHRIGAVVHSVFCSTDPCRRPGSGRDAPDQA